jgi:drug/metabolite transporter (DMT)-like permease
MAAADLLRLIALAACWGLAFVFIRVAVPATGPFALVELRAVIASLLLYGYLRASGIPFDLRRNWPRYAVSGAVGSAIPFAMIATAQTVQSASYSVVLVGMAPMFSALIAAMWMGERFTWRKGAGLLVGLAGVALLTGWDPSTAEVPPAWSVALTLGAAIFYGIAGVYAKKYTAGIPPRAQATGSQMASALMLLPPALLALPQSSPSLVVWANIVALAAFSSALAFMLYFRLIANIGPVKTVSVNYLTPLFGVAGGVVFLGEKLTANILLGALAIFAGLAMVMARAPAPATEAGRPA